jgi:hypothetical protein
MKIRTIVYKNSEIRAVIEALNSEGGVVLMRMLSEAMQHPVNELIQSSEDADINRGRISVYQDLLQLRDNLRAQIEDRKKAEEKN